VKEVLPDIHRWNESGDRIVVASVADVQRSAARSRGAKDSSGAGVRRAGEA
jgi:xanthine/CO dehydrogenase XdhC/CoxF family maturation factor